MGCILPDKRLTPVMEEKPAAVKEAEEVFTDAVGEYPDENVENRARFYLGAARTQLTAAWRTLHRASLYRIVSFYERKCIRENVTAQYVMTRSYLG